MDVPDSSLDLDLDSRVCSGEARGGEAGIESVGKLCKEEVSQPLFEDTQWTTPEFFLSDLLDLEVET